MQFILFILLCLQPLVLSGTPPEQTAVTSIPHVARFPSIDAFSETIPVDSGIRVDEFWQRQPSDGKHATLGTQAFLAYDDVSLHVVFICRDDPRQVRAHMSRRESISGDDIVGVSIDSFNDGRHAYMFYVNPLGVQLDGVTTEGQPDDYKFDAVWKSEGKLFANGYIVHLAIPFQSIRHRSGVDGKWAIALTRSVPRLNEYDTWPRISDRIEAYVPQFAHINAPAQSVRDRNFTITPYGFIAGQTFAADDSPQLRRQRDVRGGFDSKLVLADKLSLDVTVNPDFSQVESDEPQVTVNRRYEVFFPEKRPFFLENASFFQTPETLFFSRRILNPEFGARLTGKVGGWGIGLLTIDDRNAGGVTVNRDRAVIGVARITRDFGRESSIGGLFTTRRVGAVNNQVAGVDLRWKASPNWVFTGQAYRTQTSVSAQPNLAGSGLFGEARHIGRHVQNISTYRDRSRDLDAPLAFLPRTDIRQIENDFSYRWRPESSTMTSFGPSVYAIATRDHAGRLQDWSMRTPFWFDIKGPTSAYVSHNEAYEVYRGIGYRTRTQEAYVSSDYFKKFGVTATLVNGTGINYTPSAGNGPSLLRIVEATADITVRPTNRLRVDETYFYTRGASPAAVVFTNHLARSKINYQFTRALSTRVILDYNGVLANHALSSLQSEKRLTTDVLFTYFLHPGTAIYFGYTDRRDNSLWLNGPGLTRTFAGAPTGISGRQLFVKVSYLLRL